MVLCFQSHDDETIVEGCFSHPKVFLTRNPFLAEVMHKTMFVLLCTYHVAERRLYLILLVDGEVEVESIGLGAPQRGSNPICSVVVAP